MAAFDKVLVVTQKTALEELIERYNTRDQARFYVEHMGVSFDGYQAAHDAYRNAVNLLTRSLPQGVRHQFIDRSFLPTFLFGECDLVVALGRDGLVANTAKYLKGQPLVGLNPDPERIDGVLLPFPISKADSVLNDVVAGKYTAREVTMAQASLNDGRTLLAVNDLFLGQRTHTSARYRIAVGDRAEDQSSSGVIVSTGAGSTGWYRSILAGAAGVVEEFGGPKVVRAIREKYRFDWEARELRFTVREPFVSKTSRAGLVCGSVAEGKELVITSQMPRDGVIFSDGIEADRLEFNSGGVVKIGVAARRLRLVDRCG